MFIKKEFPKVIIIAVLAFFLTGCGSYSSEPLDNNQQSAGVQLPEWLHLSYRADATNTTDEYLEVYQMDEIDLTGEKGNAEDADIPEGESTIPSTSTGGSAGTKQSEQKASTPDASKQSVGSTWYDLLPSGGTSQDSIGQFEFNVEINAED